MDPKTTTARRAAALLAVLVAAALPALLARGLLVDAAARTELAAAPNAYLLPAHALRLYVATPLVAGSACVLLLAPGLLLALALDAADDVGRWIASALALGTLTVSAAAGVVQTLLGAPLRGGAFAAVVVGCAAAGAGALVLRLAAGRPTAWPLAQPHSGATLAAMAAAPLALFVALLPKFLWESFNGDGAHAFESARLLLVQPLPFWPREAGDIAAFPGVTSMLFAFPASWFVRLFGEIEVAARLPLLLYLPALFGVLVSLCEHGRGPLPVADRWLLWLGLAVYTVTLAYSATYSPYFADVALPATQDTLLLVCFLAFALAFARGDAGWMIAWALLCYASLPSGVMLLGLFLAATLAAGRPWPKRALAIAGGALAIAVVGGALAPAALGALGLPRPGIEYGALGLLRRFAFLQVTDVSRALFAVVPCGILPALGLFAFRRHDRLARVLALTCLGYFAAFYVQAHVSLHHYVPAMVLPLAVFWRSAPPPGRDGGVALRGLAAACGAAALWLSLPTHAAPHTHPRAVGAAVDDRLGGYERVDPAAMRRSTLLHHAIPYAWDPRVPEESYGGSPLVWYYYGHRPERSGTPVTYVLQSSADPPPDAMRPIAEEDGVALYVASERAWRAHLALRPPAPAGSPIYAIPRGILFRSVALEDGPPVLSVVDLLGRLGVDTEALLRRLGVSDAA